MTARLGSWGRYPDFPQTGRRVHWRDQLSHAFEDLVRAHGTTLGYGRGRSYGDSCLAASDRVLCLGSLDRLIEADWPRGVVRVEAGVSLEDLIRVALPRGWFLPVTPGTKFATLGGCLANDVHGKNHHRRGTIGRHVRRFALLRSDRGLIECAPGENEALYRATIGGLGLTGIVVWVELELLPVRSSLIDTLSIRFGSLDEFFQLSAEHDREHEYSVAWIDCRAGKGATGRGLFIVGDHADEGPLAPAAPGGLAVPFTPPFSLVNAWTIAGFNTLYYHRQRRRQQRKRAGYDGFFYPLDGVIAWNRIYGRRGFQQYQCVVPESAGRDAIAAMLKAIAECGVGSFLAVLKRCGDIASPGLLSFPMPGPTLAVDVPQSEGMVAPLFQRLDRILNEAGGRLYPAKDAHMAAADFQRANPGWERVEELRDPALLSRFWQRVTRA
jgi:FAD/FMN-containing dehydrogenase